MDELFIFQLQRRIEECRRGSIAVQSSPQMSGYPRARGSDVPAGTLVSADRCELPPDALPVRPGVIAEYLRFFEELSYEEIAQRTSLPLGTVKAQLFRAKNLLYQILHSRRERM